MAPSRVAATSGVFFQGDAPSQTLINHQTGRSNLGPVSRDISHQTVLNSVANSANSIGASSLVTDANSAFSGGPQLQRSTSFNTDSYMRLPNSPMSFTSNNISVSGSSIVDADQNPQHQGASSVTSPVGSRIPNSFIPDTGSLSQVQKKPRLDIKQEDIMQQQVIQQLLQRDPMQLQRHNPQLQAFIQQQRLRQQQQILQAMPQMQRAQLQQQQQQQQLRQQLQQQNMQQIAKNPHDTGGICARRLMQYLFHQRKPTENTISYWKSFVKEYYAPRAKKRWCLSLYENVAHQAFGVFPQATMDAWHCDICGSKSGRGFEATYEVLPRLNEVKFSSGVIDELLFLDVPRERRSVSGIMMLEYAKAVQETIYEQVRIVREGHLRIIFAQDLKILSWEFCARRHEELLPRRLVASQVNQLLQVAQKCQNTINESGSEGVSTQDLQSNSNMVVTAGRQLAKCLELQSLNDLGFSKRYVRCLQIAEVVNNMKDLIDFCSENKAGPIEGLKNFTRNASAPSPSKLQMQEMEQLANMQGLPTDRNTLNKLMAMQPAGTNNNPPNVAARAALSGPAAAAMALTNYQSMLMRQSSINSNPGSAHQDNPNPSPSPSSSFQGPGPGYSSPQLGPHQHSFSSPQLGPGPGPGPQQQRNQPSQQQPSQSLQQQMIQQILQGGAPGQQQKMLIGQNGMGVGSAGVGQQGGPMLTKCNSFKSGSNGDTSAGKPAELAQSLHLADEMVQELTNDFSDNALFSSLDDTLAYTWKA